MEPTSFAWVTLASVLSALPAEGEVVSQAVINTHISPAIAGQWQIQLDNEVAQATGCRELYHFAADNQMWAVSGEEWTYGRYLISYPEQGLPIIALQTVYDNNAVDCSGNQVDQTGEAIVAFLDHQHNQMQWCADPKGQHCFMQFDRVLP